MHAAKLVFRSSLFLAVLAVYVPAKLRGTEGFYEVFAGVPWLLPFIWTVFMNTTMLTWSVSALKRLRLRIRCP